MTVRIVTLAVVMLIVANFQASTQGGEAKMVFGQGINSCGAWTQARQTRPANAGLSAQWVAGFLSGMNVEAISPDALGGTDFDGLMGWVDNYCKSNPLETIINAALMLMKELRSRAQRR
jgi:hypothetical protein